MWNCLIEIFKTVFLNRNNVRFYKLKFTVCTRFPGLCSNDANKLEKRTIVITSTHRGYKDIFERQAEFPILKGLSGEI
jgi:hypothetical protein